MIALTIRAIAAESPADNGIRRHLAHLFEKLSVTSRTEAIKVATRRGLVRLE